MLSSPYCPRCHSIRVVKSGHHYGKQRWLCRRWRSQFTRTDQPAETNEPTQRAAVTHYWHGLSFRCVANVGQMGEKAKNLIATENAAAARGEATSPILFVDASRRLLASKL